MTFKIRSADSLVEQNFTRTVLAMEKPCICEELRIYFGHDIAENFVKDDKILKCRELQPISEQHYSYFDIFFAPTAESMQ